eukprot:scaffold655_cov379-Prasinococcus_capsulatus_cf.AAC.15
MHRAPTPPLPTGGPPAGAASARARPATPAAADAASERATARDGAECGVGTQLHLTLTLVIGEGPMNGPSERILAPSRRCGCRACITSLCVWP